jgi:limonene-1,2-epoxide hydrolase
MKEFNKYFLNIYDHFNKRNIDYVISNMTADVKWANGMEGGYVHGHEGVREYWTRQFKLVSSEVTPSKVREQNGKVFIKVHQVVHDLDGNLIADATVIHIFTMDGDKIAEFDIAPAL